MADKRLIASIALTAGLLGGGAAGFILGVPGVSGAQTTTVPDQPGATAPDNGQTTPDRPPHGDGENCPHMGGSTGEARNGPGPNGQGISGSVGNVRFGRGPGNRV
jgi:hypothetical protein